MNFPGSHAGPPVNTYRTPRARVGYPARSEGQAMIIILGLLGLLFRALPGVIAWVKGNGTMLALHLLNPMARSKWEWEVRGHHIRRHGHRSNVR
jgi:hypothetical protein